MVRSRRRSASIDRHPRRQISQAPPNTSEAARWFEGPASTSMCPRPGDTRSTNAHVAMFAT
jgi:hypothetical protein